MPVETVIPGRTVAEQGVNAIRMLTKSSKESIFDNPWFRIRLSAVKESTGLEPGEIKTVDVPLYNGGVTGGVLGGMAGWVGGALSYKKDLIEAEEARKDGVLYPGRRVFFRTVLRSMGWGVVGTGIGMAAGLKVEGVLMSRRNDPNTSTGLEMLATGSSDVVYAKEEVSVLSTETGLAERLGMIKAQVGSTDDIKDSRPSGEGVSVGENDGSKVFRMITESGLAMGGSVLPQEDIEPQEDEPTPWDEPTLEQALKREGGLEIPENIQNDRNIWKPRIIQELTDRDYRLNKNRQTEYFQYKDPISQEFRWIEVPIAENNNMLWAVRKDENGAFVRYGEYPVESELVTEGDVTYLVPDFDTGFMEISGSQDAHIAFTGEGGKPVPVRNIVELADGRKAYLEFFNVWENEWQVNQAVQEAIKPVDYSVSAPMENFRKNIIPEGALLDGSLWRFLKTLSRSFDPGKMKKVAKIETKYLTGYNQEVIVYDLDTAPNFRGIETIGSDSQTDFRRVDFGYLIDTSVLGIDGRQCLVTATEFCNWEAEDPRDPDNNAWVIHVYPTANPYSAKFVDHDSTPEIWRHRMKYLPILTEAEYPLIQFEEELVTKRVVDPLVYEFLNKYTKGDRKKRVNRFVKGDRGALDGFVLLTRIAKGDKGWYE